MRKKNIWLFIYVIMVVAPFIGKGDSANDPGFRVIEFKKNKLSQTSKKIIKKKIEFTNNTSDSIKKDVQTLSFAIYLEEQYSYIKNTRKYIKRSAEIIKYLRNELLFKGTITIIFLNETQIVILSNGEKKTVQGYFR